MVGSSRMHATVKNYIKRILALDLPLVMGLKAVYKNFYYLCVFGFEAWLLLRKIFLVSPMFRSVCTSVGKGLRIEDLPYMRGQGEIHLGNNVYISGKIIISLVGKNRPTLSIGNNTFIGHGCAFYLRSGITIGDNCLLASNIFIQDNDGHPLDAAARARGDAVLPEQIKPVVIGNNVWLGFNAVILKGVNIGDNAIIGAGAIVTKDVAPNTIVAGNPARIIGRLPITENN